jgi:uncharacterized protein (UPF0335 family)
LDLARTSSGNGLPESCYWNQTRAEHWIDLGNVRSIEKVERLHDKVQAFRLTKREVFEDAQIQRHNGWILQRVSSKA